MTNRPGPQTAGPRDVGPETDSAELRTRVRSALARQPSRTVTVLSSLLAAQDEIGYLPAEALDEVAQRTGASPNEVWGVASFYPNFRFTKPARHKVEVCWGPTCHILGAQGILQGLLGHLSLESEGDSEDGAVTLKMNTCLGVCPHAPAASFDDEVMGHMSLDRALRQVALLRADDDEQLLAERLAEEAARWRAEREARLAARRAQRATHDEDTPPQAGTGETETPVVDQPAATDQPSSDETPGKQGG